MKKIGILSTFSNLDPAYSLVTVVLQQLQMLKRNGYQPILFGLTNFMDQDKVPEGVELRAVVPQWVLEPYEQPGSPVPDDFQANVDKTKELDLYLVTHMEGRVAVGEDLIVPRVDRNVALKQA